MLYTFHFTRYGRIEIKADTPDEAREKFADATPFNIEWDDGNELTEHFWDEDGEEFTIDEE